MTHDPPRWLESENDGELVALLRAGESDVAPHDVLARVGARIHAPAAAESPLGAPSGASRAFLFKVAVGIAALVGMFTAQRWLEPLPSAAERSPARSVPAVSVEREKRATASVDEVSPRAESLRKDEERSRAPAQTREARPVPRAIETRARRSAPPPPPRLADNTRLAEAQLLERARAVVAQQPTRTLELLREHERRFPATWLAEERAALSIRALARAGEREQARARLSAFKREFPASAQLAALDRALGEP